MSGRDIGIIALVVIGVLILLPALGWIGMMGGWGMMGPGMMGPWGGGRWGGGWGMPFFGMIFWVLILVGIGLVLSSYLRKTSAAPPVGSAEAPLDILKRRLAAGEITREEYEAIKKELS
ncbi:MAG: SHOCT domain-containing protein [Armatimonadetes bacterium]|nr:SHOCT domain-containing protein [Armatimonadota bacterium]